MHSSVFQLLKNRKISLHLHREAGSGPFRSCHGYVHSPTYCHDLVVHDLANWRKPDNVNLYHYIDDLLLTSDSLEVVEQAADSLTTYLQERGWAINPQKVQGPGLSLKFLGGGVARERWKTTQCSHR